MKSNQLLVLDQVQVVQVQVQLQLYIQNLDKVLVLLDDNAFTHNHLDQSLFASWLIYKSAKFQVVILRTELLLAPKTEASYLSNRCDWKRDFLN